MMQIELYINNYSHLKNYFIFSEAQIMTKYYQNIG